MIRAINLRILLVLACLVSACAQFGLQPAQGPEDTLRYAQANLTGAYKTIGAAAADGSMDAARARSIYDRLEQPNKDLALIDRVVRTTNGTVPSDMVSKLTFANAILLEIAKELRASLPESKTAALPPAPQPAR